MRHLLTLATTLLTVVGLHAANVANGRVHDYITSVRILCSVPQGDEPAKARVQFGYLNEGSAKADGRYSVSGRPLDPAASEFPIELVFRPGRRETPGALRITYDSSSNLVGRYEYLAYDASEGQAVWVKKGTETAPNLAGKLVPTLSDLSIDADAGTFLASFGYDANWHPGIVYPVTVKVNKLNNKGTIVAGAKPVLFSAGSHDDVFTVEAPLGKTVKWNLGCIIVSVSADLADG